MVLLPDAVKAEIVKRGSEKRDYRNQLVSKLTLSITFSYVESDTGFGYPATLTLSLWRGYFVASHK
jgi:hypothetical protein